MGRGDDGLQTAAAQTVERQRGCLVRQTPVDTRHACQVVIVWICMYDIAEYDMPDLLGIDIGSFHGLPYTVCC